MEPTVLIASNDADFCIFVGHVLAHNGFRSCVVDPSDRIADDMLRAADAIIVASNDDMQTVLAFCQRVRAVPSPQPVPLMALIAARHEQHYLSLVKSGVDQCVLRPVAPELIVSCLISVIEKRGRSSAKTDRVDRQSAGLDTRDDTRQLIGHAGSTHLTKTEYRLLKRLLANPGHVVSRRQLIEAAWPTARHVEPRTVDVHIGKLRRALVMTTGRQVIRTIRSSGFVAELPAADDDANHSS
jgi:two-component system phosphate regulon response regulator PhoB